MTVVVRFPPGMHIADAAQLLCRRAKETGSEAVATFNDVGLKATPGQTAQEVVIAYEAAAAERQARWRSSPEGKAFAAAQEEELRKLQEQALALDAQVDQLDFTDQAAVLAYLGELQPCSDRIGVAVDRARILAAFAGAGLVPNMDLGWTVADRDTFFHWLVGQALDGLDRGPSIHGVFHRFADEWRAKWGVA